jgi:hypothetical protein
MNNLNETKIENVVNSRKTGISLSILKYKKIPISKKFPVQDKTPTDDFIMHSICLILFIG